MKLSDLMTTEELVEAIGTQLKVEKDDDASTTLVDPQTGTKTVIDKKKNPNAIAQDNTGKAIMTDKPEPGQKKAPLKPGTQVATPK